MKIRALVFDDEELIRLLLKTILEDRGYEVFAFSGPGVCPMYINPEFHCKGNGQCADIILSDVKMPHASGIDLLKKLDKNGCRVKNRALVSGSWTDADINRAKELNCKIFEKPFIIQEIEEWLDRCERSIDSNRILSNCFQ